jgi:hypothetical protein
MKTSVLIAALVAVLASGAIASSSSTSAQGKFVLYGHVKSVTHTSRGYQLRFDPAWWLTGSAAEHACGCKPVANDYFVVDETHRLLTFPVRANARVRIVVGGPKGITPASISVAELAQIVAGKNPRHRVLLARTAGFWLTFSQKYPSPVLSLDQQYQP